MSKKIKYLKILEDASICQCFLKVKEYIDKLSENNNRKIRVEDIFKFDDFLNLKYNIYDHLDYKYIILFESNQTNELQRNIIKLPFTSNDYYGIIYIFKIDNDVNIINLSTNKFMSLFDKIKINKLIEEDYSSDDFNPDVCNNSKMC